MQTCDECGSGELRAVRLEGVRVEECNLCGNIAGDDAAVQHVLTVREAREQGVDPEIFPLVRLLERIPGLHVMRSDGGDPQARVWPHVLMGLGGAALPGLESLAKSLALSNAGSDLHWVLELEYQKSLAVTLKPRFHRGLEQIGSEEVRHAQEDLRRVRANLERDMYLSWWRV